MFYREETTNATSSASFYPLSVSKTIGIWDLCQLWITQHGVSCHQNQFKNLPWSKCSITTNNERKCHSGNRVIDHSKRNRQRRVIVHRVSMFNLYFRWKKPHMIITHPQMYVVVSRYLACQQYPHLHLLVLFVCSFLCLFFFFVCCFLLLLLVTLVVLVLCCLSRCCFLACWIYFCLFLPPPITPSSVLFFVYHAIILTFTLCQDSKPQSTPARAAVITTKHNSVIIVHLYSKSKKIVSHCSAMWLCEMKDTINKYIKIVCIFLGYSKQKKSENESKKNDFIIVKQSNVTN